MEHSMELYMMTEINLNSFKHKDLKPDAAQGVVASSGKKPDSFKRRVEVFAAAFTHLPVRRSSRPSHPGFLDELGAIEASIGGPLGPTPDDHDNSSLPHSVSLGAHSVLVSDMSSQRITASSAGGAHPDASTQANPQGLSRSLSACVSGVKAHCKTAAAALAPKNSTNSNHTGSNSRRNKHQQEEESYGDADILGMDPCAYKLSFVAPRWLSKASSKGASASASAAAQAQPASRSHSSSSCTAPTAAAAVSQESAQPAVPTWRHSTASNGPVTASDRLNRFKTRVAGYFQKLPSVHIPSFKSPKAPETPSTRRAHPAASSNPPATPSPCGEAPSTSMWARHSSQRKSSGGGSRRSTGSGPRCGSPLAQWLHDLPAVQQDSELLRPYDPNRQSSGGRSTGSGKRSKRGSSGGGSNGLSRIDSGMDYSENYPRPFQW